MVEVPAYLGFNLDRLQCGSDNSPLSMHPLACPSQGGRNSASFVRGNFVASLFRRPLNRCEPSNIQCEELRGSGCESRLPPWSRCANPPKLYGPKSEARSSWEHRPYTQRDSLKRGCRAQLSICRRAEAELRNIGGFSSLGFLGVQGLGY